MPFQKWYFEMKENSFPFLLLCSPSYRPQAVKNVKRPRILNWHTENTENTLLNTLSSWEILGPGILVNL